MQGSWESSPQIKKERPWVVVSTTERSRWVSLVKRKEYAGMKGRFSA